MNDLPSETAKLGEPGQLIAAIPHLLRFHPADVILLVTIAGNGPSRICAVLGVDPTQTSEHEGLAHHLAVAVQGSGATGAIAVVVGHGEEVLPDLPHQDFLAMLDHAMGAHGVAFVHAVWTASTHEGSLWRCYDNPNCAGTVASSDQTPVAAASVAAGRVTFASRAQLAGTLEPDDDATLARRAGVISDLLKELEAADQSDFASASREGFRIVRAAIQDALEGRLELDDDTIALLTVALSIPAVRDAHLATAMSETSSAAEHLWTVLTKATPGSYRAEPALLLATSAFLRGDGALADIALTAAEDAQPEHVLAIGLRLALDHGLPPDRIADDVAQLAIDAEQHLMAGHADT